MHSQKTLSTKTNKKLHVFMQKYALNMQKMLIFQNLPYKCLFYKKLKIQKFIFGSKILISYIFTTFMCNMTK